MSSLRAAIQKHPITAFAIATYVLSWWSVPFAGGGLIPHGPFLAAVILLALTEGRAGVSRLLRRLTAWPGRWYWFVIGPGLVVAYLLVAALLNSILGGATNSVAPLRSFGPTFLMLLLLGGLWEEPGWTGYALPLLQERYASRPRGLLLASLHVGAIRALWHLPLVLSGAIAWYDMLFLSFALQFLISWIFNRTGGSLLVVMLLHLTSNVVGGGLMLPLYAGLDNDRYYKLFIAVAALLAIALARMNGWSMGRRTPAEAAAQPGGR